MTEPTRPPRSATSPSTCSWGPTDLEDALRTDVAKGLVASPKELPPKWFYDDRGCDLFDQITRLPEYYPTEAERSILRAEADAIVEQSGADTLVELGSGTSDKTRVLLDAFAAGRPARAASARSRSARPRCGPRPTSIGDEYPGVEVHAVVGDFERHLGQLPQGGRRMVAFLGSTIGNFTPGERARFLTDLVDGLAPGRQPAARHRPGEGRRPARGGLRRRRRRHRRVQPQRAAGHEPRARRRLRRSTSSPTSPASTATRSGSRCACGRWPTRPCTSPRSTSRSTSPRGEEVRTEISAKFRRAGVEAELAAAGLRVVRWMTDPAGDFALSLSVVA